MTSASNITKDMAIFVNSTISKSTSLVNYCSTAMLATAKTFKDKILKMAAHLFVKCIRCSDYCHQQRGLQAILHNFLSMQKFQLC